MDRTFLEEDTHLRKTINIIDDHISTLSEQYQKEKDEMSGGVVSNDDYQNFKYHQNYCLSLQRDITEYKSLKDEPYFARIDLEDTNKKEDESKAYYIGNTSYSKGLDHIIFDWRSDYGEIYYQKNSTSFSLEKSTKRLLLRRSYLISNGILKKYKNEYSEFNGENTDDIIDPFLIDIIRERKNSRSIKDIIRSIQAEQYSIIQKPLDKNIVVQGCAGSGKTMILLHRLSYLMFNNKYLNGSNFNIISPNMYLNQQMSQLSGILEIDQIPILTHEEFYSDIYSSYKSKIRDNSIKREVRYSSQMYKTLYSKDFYDLFEVSFVERDKFLLVDKDIKKFSNIKKLITQIVPDITFSNDSYTSEIENINLILAQYNQLKSRRLIIEELLETSNPNSYQNRIKSQKSRMRALKVELENKYLEYLIKCDDKVFELSTNRLTLAKDIETTNVSIEALNKIKNSISIPGTIIDEPFLINFFENVFPLHQSKYSSINIDQISEIIKAESKQLLNLQQQMNSQSSFLSKILNFSKIKKIKQLDGRIRVRIDKLCEHVLDSLKKQIESSAKIISTLETELLFLEDTKNEKLQFLDENNLLSKFDLKSTYLEWLDIRIPYDDVTNSIIQLENDLKKTRSELSLLKDINQDTLNFLIDHRNSYESLANNDFSFFSKLVRQLITNVPKSDVENIINTINKPSLFLRLLFCKLAFGKVLNKKHYFIDEAQTFSRSEYRLLFSLLDNGSVFNLFGDQLQSVNPDKDTTDFKSLNDLIRFDYLELNRNYRNTVQIAEYNNASFDLKILPIGVDGPKVKELDSNMFNETLLNLQLQLEKNRVALIVKDVLSFKESKLYINKPSNIRLSDLANLNEIMLYDIETIKGLEFEIVLVCAADMTKNEKYLSFTRALSELIIIYN